MLALARNCLILIGLLVLYVPLHAQQIELTYAVDKGANNLADTVRVFAQSMTRQSIGIRAINASIVFNGGENNVLGFNSHFSRPWTPTFERARIDTTPNTYWGHTYQNRWNYGIGDALGSANSIVRIPADTSEALMILELYFRSLGPGLIYVEDQSENPVNQIGDSSFRQLPYQVRALPGTFPVVWSYFEVKNVPQEGVLLQWETASELNNDVFVVEKSSDRDFAMVETLGTLPGQGTSTDRQQYAFLDNSFSEEKRHYRIKQVDIDGAFSYSNIQEIIVPKSSFRLHGYYKKEEDRLTIQLSDLLKEGIDLFLLNPTGQVVWRERPFINPRPHITISISTLGFRPGLYFLQARTRDVQAQARLQKILIH